LNAQRVKLALVGMPRVKIVKLDGFKIYRATPRAVNVPLDSVIQPKVLRHAMLFLLVHTVGMVKFMNVKRVIIVKEKQQIKPPVNLDRTPPTKVLSHASNVHPARMPTHWAPLIVKTAVMIPTNQIPMLRSVFQCEKGSTNRVQQPKLNVRRVKQEVGATQRAKTAWKDTFKMHRATPRAANAQVVTTTKQTVRQHATLSLPVPIIGIKWFANVIPVTIVLVSLPIKRHAIQVHTLQTVDSSNA
jgi:hypothetical protein